MNLAVGTGTLTVEIDPSNGSLAAVRNEARDLSLITRPRDLPPFRLELVGVGSVDSFDDFVVSSLPDGLRLSWVTHHSITLTAQVRARDREIVFLLHALNRGALTIDRLEFPIIAGIGRLVGPGQDVLVHSHATGMLFHDPIDLLNPDPGNLRHLQFSPYPNGFAGSTMQFMAYFARGRGGFFIGTEDAAAGMKGFNFAGHRSGLVASITHKAPALRPGTSFVPAYPVVLSGLTEGTWHEAADRYRIWAIDQSWATSTNRRSWLDRDVGICTFGINARYDRSPWLDMIHRAAGTQVLHVLGPNWARWGHDYHNQMPRGRDDWFPATFSEANLSTIRRNCDRWAPFEFDLLCGHDPGSPDPVLESRLLQNPSEARLTDPGLLELPLMCAGTTYWRDFHIERDVRLVKSHDADALYYDISVNNLLLQCLAANHAHPPGAGTAVAEVFAEMYGATAAAASAAKGAHVPTGTELISEIFLKTFDFYQARAEAGPYAPFECAPFRDWVLDGRAQKIPLLRYVYGRRSPLRMDGWGRLARDAGDLFYWTAATVVLNGGLFQLNYEFSPLEELDGRTDIAAEHYYRFDARSQTIDPAKAAFVGEVARTRVGPANRFLAEGTMLPAPHVDAPDVALGYRAYNMGKGEPLFDTGGRMTVPSVLASAWQVDGRSIWLVANLLPAAQDVRVDGKRLHLPARTIRVVDP